MRLQFGRMEGESFVPVGVVGLITLLYGVNKFSVKN